MVPMRAMPPPFPDPSFRHRHLYHPRPGSAAYRPSSGSVPRFDRGPPRPCPPRPFHNYSRSNADTVANDSAHHSRVRHTPPHMPLTPSASEQAMLLYNLNFYELPEVDLDVLRQMLLRRQANAIEAPAVVPQNGSEDSQRFRGHGITKRARVEKESTDNDEDNGRPSSVNEMDGRTEL